MTGKEKAKKKDSALHDDWHNLFQASGLFHMLAAKSSARNRRADDKLGRVTVNQARIFGYIFSKTDTDIRIKHLAHDLDVTPAAASQAVERLVAEGLLDRRPDPTDRRAVIVSISDKGRKVLNEIRAESTALLTDIYRETGLPAEDIAAFSRVLDALHAALLARWRARIGRDVSTKRPPIMCRDEVEGLKG